MINRYQGIKAQVCQKHSQPILAYQKEIPFCQICLVEQLGMVSSDEYSQKLDEILFKENQENDKQLRLLQQLLNELSSYQINLNKHLEKIIVLIKEQISVIKRQSEQFQNIIDQTQNQQKLLTQLEKELKNKQEGNLTIRQIIQKSLQFQLLRQTQQQINIVKQVEVVKKSESGDTNIIEQLDTNKILNQVDQSEIIEGNISQAQQSDKSIRQNQIPEQKQDIDNSSQLVIQSGKQLMVDNSIKYRKFQYEKISDAKIKKDITYNSFAFNSDATILFIGGVDKTIKVYEFQNGKILKIIQTLSKHTNWVSCLVFMKKSNSLVSGSDDKSIIIWNQDQNNSWQPQQILESHTGYIYCMIINEDEDLLISGSNDKTIKFQKKVNLSWSGQQTIDVSFCVRSLSLNTSQTKLISCGRESNIIKVIEHQSDQQWIITQTIKVDQYGFRLCFINDNQFVFQPKTNGFLEIYNYEQEKKQFVKAKQVQVQNCKDCTCYFPCQFIESKNILIVKHGKYVNFLGIDQNGDYVLQQSIQFGDETHQFGRLTDDGQFLITWDRESNEIQVRKLSYFE